MKYESMIPEPHGEYDGALRVGDLVKFPSGRVVWQVLSINWSMRLDTGRQGWGAVLTEPGGTAYRRDGWVERLVIQ